MFVLWAYARIVTRRQPPSAWLWTGLFAGAASALYAHYFALVPLIAIGLYHLLFARRNWRWRQVVGVMAAAGALFLPWVPNLLSGAGRIEADDNLHSHALNAPQALWSFFYMFGNGVVVDMAALVAVAAACRDRRARRLFFALAVLGLILALNQIAKVMHSGRLRYLISLWPPFALVIRILDDLAAGRG